MMGLNWAQWALIGLYAFSAIWGVSTVGKEREPRTPGEAALGLAITVVMVFLVVEAGAP
jgi:hypothetical protein